MSVDSMAYGSATVLTGQSLSLMPSSATEHYIIHNINVPFGSTCELYQTDGVYTILVGNISNSMLSYNLHCSTSHYYTVKNVGTTSITISYNGAIV